MPDFCGSDQITVKEPGKDTIRQCIQCRKCAKGEGSTVQCNAVVTPDTLVGCEKCQLGRTFSAEDGTGICKPCDDCEALGRLTEKTCTLTSNGVCGGCKPGRYEDRLTSQCERCSACCGDDRDTKEKECEDQGLPTDKVCNVRRVCPKKPINTPPSGSLGRKRSKATVPSPKATPSPSRSSRASRPASLTPPSVWPSRQQMHSIATTSVISKTGPILAREGRQPPSLSSSNSMALYVGIPLALVVFVGLAIYRFIKRKQRPSCRRRREPVPALEVGPPESTELVGVAPTVDGENEEGGRPIQDTEGPGHFLPDLPLEELVKNPSWDSRLNQAITKAGGPDAARRRFEASVGEVPIERGEHVVFRVFVEAVIQGYPKISGKYFLEVVSGEPEAHPESGTMRETVVEWRSY